LIPPINPAGFEEAEALVYTDAIRMLIALAEANGFEVYGDCSCGCCYAVVSFAKGDDEDEVEIH
jgi:hypothetical protein